jgi:hypothetical protein
MARGDGYRTKQLDLCREKIKTSQLLNRLQNNALGTLELNSVQQRSIEILLRKVLPDLSQVEQTGDVASFVMRLPEPAVDTAAWERTNSVSTSLADTDTTKH